MQVLPDASLLIPPSKSLTHRALVCAALAKGPSKILNPLRCDDTLATTSCLEALGISIEKLPDYWTVHGGTFCKPTQKLFCNESGTTYRFLTALTECLEIPCEFDGKPSLLKRSQRPDPQTSSQYLSGLILAAPYAKKKIPISIPKGVVSKPYIVLTLEMQKKFGFQNKDGVYKPAEVTIEGCWSSAAFLIALGVLVKPVKLEGLNRTSLQGDKAIVTILKEMGADIEWQDHTLVAKPSQLKAITWDLTDTPDLYPILCVLAHFAKGKSSFSGIERLTFKESNRLEEIKKVLDPATKVVDSNDHRIIMAAAVLEAAADKRFIFKNPGAVNKSWPEFWKILATLSLPSPLEGEG